MRILLIHATRFTYNTVEEAISKPLDPPSSGEFRNCLVVFTTIETGDGELEASRAASDILVQANRLGVNCIIVYPYAHLSSNLAPPDRAHRVLTYLEDILRKNWEGIIHRTPFGWYKAFNIECPGHPLAELSRSIRGEQIVKYKGLPLEEAQAGGIIESWLLQRNPWSNETLELVERLGLNEVHGRVTLWELEQFLIRELGVTRRVRVENPENIYGFQGAASLSKLCSESPHANVQLFWGDMGESIIVSTGDRRELLVKLGVRIGDLIEVKLGDDGLDVGVSGYTLMYRARRGGAVPLAYVVGVRYCLGPLTSIAYAILDSGLKDVDGGGTPVLHYKLAPIQVAIIPVGGAHGEYARTLESRVRELGVRVKVLEEGGLGARIRDAGRLWIPLVAVVGDKEVATNTVSLRRRWEPGKQEVISIEDLLNEVKRLNASNLG